jgi:hypothetical protein
MPIVSEDTGHPCPRKGCGGFCDTNHTGHTRVDTRRIRVCRKCGAYGPSKEVNVGKWQFPIPACVDVEDEIQVSAKG